MERQGQRAVDGDVLLNYDVPDQLFIWILFYKVDWRESLHFAIAE